MVRAKDPNRGIDTGHSVCFASGVWGYLEESREQWKPLPVKVRKEARMEPVTVDGLGDVPTSHQKAFLGAASVV